jgi:hypothetical protein
VPENGAARQPAATPRPGRSSLVSTVQAGDTAIAFTIGAVLMIAAGLEAFLGVKAERQSLEDIATPLTAQDAETAPSRAG